VHLLGFIIRIYHDEPSSERQLHNNPPTDYSTSKLGRNVVFM